MTYPSKKLKPGEVPPEHEDQALFVQWFRREFPDVIIFAIPNGGSRHPAVAAKLKVEGVVKGVPDLFIPAWRVWVEMKRQKGSSTSKDQKELFIDLELLGYSVFICKGFEEAKKTIKEIRCQFT